MERILSHHTQNPNNSPYTPEGIVLSAGRALWGSAFAQLRALSVDVSADSFRVYFISDGLLNEDQEEECHCIGTEILADFPDAVEGFEEIFVCSPEPESILAPGTLVYMRRERHPQNEAIARGARIKEVLQGASVNRPNLLFAVNQALLGEVTPSLRRVVADWSRSPTTILFYYDGPVTDLEKSIGGRVAAVIKTWLPELQVQPVVERLDYPERPPTSPDRGAARGLVYMRWEPTPE